jgi:hypothetical protein
VRETCYASALLATIQLLSNDFEKPRVAGGDVVRTRRFVGVMVDGDAARRVRGTASGAKVLGCPDAAEMGLRNETGQGKDEERGAERAGNAPGGRIRLRACSSQSSPLYSDRERCKGRLQGTLSAGSKGVRRGSRCSALLKRDQHLEDT